MRPEVVDVINFVKQFEPFYLLSDDSLSMLCQQIQISYYRSGKPILGLGDLIDTLYMVRSGSVEIHRRDGQLYNRLEPGGLFGHAGLLMNGRVRYPAVAIEDCLVYRIPVDIFINYCDEFPSFGDFFEVNDNSTLQQAVSQSDAGNDMTTAKVRDIVLRDPLFLSSDTSVLNCARMMRDHHSPLAIVLDELETPIGLVDDTTIRNNVVAEGIDPNSIQLSGLVSDGLICVDQGDYVYEAMLVMMRQQIKHLPVLEGNKITGVIDLNDILNFESQNSLLLVRSLFQQDTVESLALLCGQIPLVFVRLYREQANAHMIGTAMSVIGRTVKKRLLELAEQELGAPPIPYCFLALGSMARDEQLLVTDQDNALILDSSYNELEHGEYFKQLADFVCEGLDKCGYTLCDGDIMASNPQWRMTLEEWKGQFNQWIENPDPRALLNASIFFDLDGVVGEVKWAKELNAFIAEKAASNKRFLAALARNALNRVPPLGFFREFVLEQGGDHRDSINLKRRGTAPLTDLIRVHALAVGSRAQNSFERLEDIAQSKLILSDKLEELNDAFEFLYKIRVRYQALAVIDGKEPGNNVRPDTLRAPDRRALREAFGVLGSAQRFLKYRYTARKDL